MNGFVAKVVGVIECYTAHKYFINLDNTSEFNPGPPIKLKFQKIFSLLTLTLGEGKVIE